MTKTACHLKDISTVVVKSLRKQQHEIQQAIIRHIIDVVPAPNFDDATYTDGIRQAVSASIDYSFKVLAADDHHAMEVPPAAIVQAQRAARIGLGVDAMLLRYIAGFRLLDDIVMQEAERTSLHGDAALRQLRNSHNLALQRLTSAVAQAYRQEHDRITSSPDQRAAIALRLLAGELPDASALLYTLDQIHTGLILTGQTRDSALLDLAHHTSSESLSISQRDETTWIWLGSRTGVTSHRIVYAAHDYMPSHVLIAIGEPRYGPDGFRTTHRQAQAALSVALRTNNHITRHADIVPEALALRDEELATSLVETYLSPLADLRKGALVLHQTLRAYFALDRNISSTAAHLGVARHTVEQRLRRVEKRLGRQLTTCSLELEFALRIDAIAKPAQT